MKVCDKTVWTDKKKLFQRSPELKFAIQIFAWILLVGLLLSFLVEAVFLLQSIFLELRFLSEGRLWKNDRSKKRNLQGHKKESVLQGSFCFFFV